MKTLTVRVPPDLANWLDRRARELNLSKSEIARRALEAHLNGEKAFKSLLDRAGDLVGKYASGRKDSSHKRNLKGFGSWKRSFS